MSGETRCKSKCGSWIAVATAILIAMCMIQPALAGLTLSAQQKQDLFEEAQNAYDRGVALTASDPVQAREAFSDAAARFQLIADNGPPAGELLYNLANAWLQTGDLGRAIVNYRRAERLMPANASLQHNLHYARSLCRTQIEPDAREGLVRSLLAWHFRTPLSWRFTAFAAMNAALWLVLTWLVVRPTVTGRWMAAIFAAAWMGLGASVGADVIQIKGPREGVVIADEVTVRKGHGTGYQPQFDQPLHAGVEFQMVETRGEWLHIRLRNGEEGWIESTAAALLD